MKNNNNNKKNVYAVFLKYNSGSIYKKVKPDYGVSIKLHTNQGLPLVSVAAMLTYLCTNIIIIITNASAMF